MADPAAFDVAELESMVGESEVELGRLDALSADLQSYAMALEAMGKIDKATAVSIETICANTIDTDRYPLNSFTSVPSKTNYSVTLEGIGDQIAKISKAIIEAIVKLFRKIAKFFQDLWNFIFSRQRRTDAIEKKIVEVEKSIKHIVDNAPAEVKHEVEVAIRESETEADKLLSRELSDIKNGLLESIVKKDHVHKAVHAFGASFVDFLKTIGGRIVALETDIKSLIQPNVSTDPDAVKSIVAKLKQEMETVHYNNSSLNNELHSLQLFPSNSAYRPDNFITAINGLRGRVEELYAKKDVPLLRFNEIIKSEASSSFITHSEKISDEYSVLSKDIDRLQSYSNKEIDSHAHSSVVGLGALIRNEYHAAASYLVVANIYATIMSDVTSLRLKARMLVEQAARRARKRNNEE